jgi:hypothetical protein
MERVVVFGNRTPDLRIPVAPFSWILSWVPIVAYCSHRAPRCVAITVSGSRLMPFEDVKRICQDYTIAGLKAMHEAHPAKPFRFLYVSGIGTVRDPKVTPMFEPKYAWMRVRHTFHHHESRLKQCEHLSWSLTHMPTHPRERRKIRFSPSQPRTRGRSRHAWRGPAGWWV